MNTKLNLGCSIKTKERQLHLSPIYNLRSNNIVNK